jgi:hypothetical protein
MASHLETFLVGRRDIVRKSCVGCKVSWKRQVADQIWLEWSLEWKAYTQYLAVKVRESRIPSASYSINREYMTLQPFWRIHMSQIYQIHSDCGC